MARSQVEWLEPRRLLSAPGASAAGSAGGASAGGASAGGASAPLLAAAATTTTSPPTRVMENLGRGVVAVRAATNSIFVSWRMLATDAPGIGFNLYRSANGAAAQKLNGATPLTGGTNFTDTSANMAAANSYFVRAVISGVEQAPSPSFTLAANSAVEPVMHVPLQAPAAGYWTKFIWVGDLDGDGEYDYVIDRLAPFDPADDNIALGNQYLQAYKRDGTRLWSVDLGPNSRNTYNVEPGSATISMGMYDGVTVGDLNGDGLAEVVLKVANGVTFGDGTTFTTTNNTRQFIAVLNGTTGARMSSLEMPTNYAAAGSMGVQLGIGYLNGTTPSVVGILRNRNDDKSFNDIIVAWDFNGSAVTERWRLLMGAGTANAAGASRFHQMRIVDVDGDGIDEICPGSYLVNVDGTIRYKLAGIAHGDRFHIGKFDPDRPGLQGYGIQQNDDHIGEPNRILEYYYDASTGQILWTHLGTGADVGRGAAGDIDPSVRGYEVWSFHGIHNGPTNTRLTRDPATTNPDDSAPWPNLRVWWDGDLTSEELDGTVINKFKPRNPVDPASVSSVGRVLTAYHMGASTPGTVPQFYGDIMGDWREEVVYTNYAYTELLIFTTNIPTATRLYTLAQNAEYRNSMTVKGYFQSHHVDYYLGNGMTTPPNPNISVPPPNPITLPSAPKNLTASVVSRTQVNLTWTAAAGATSYAVKRTSNNGGPHVLLAIVSSASFADTTLSGAGGSYFYVVTQNNAGVEGVPSNQAGVQIGEPPHSATYQSEDQTFGGGAAAASTNTNWAGSGYADFPSAAGAWVEFANVNGGAGGAGSAGGGATLTFRYSLGSSGTRTALLIVNGVAQNITFTSTSSWNAWGFVTANVTLKPGATNAIRIQSTTASDISNIDQMRVDVPSPPAIFDGGAAGDRYFVRRNGAALDVWLGGAGDGAGSPTHSLVYSQAISLAFSGNAGDDTLTIDFSGGNPIPSNGISFDGGEGTGDTLAIVGSSAADTATFDSNSVVIGGAGTIALANDERRAFAGNGGSDSLTINARSVILAGPLRAAALNVAAAATLDLRNHGLIRDYSGASSPLGAWNGSGYTGITGMIQRGYNYSAWNGVGGIITSMPDAAAGLTTLALAEASEILGVTGAQTATWNGQTVDATTVLVKYTYAGDLDLNGYVDAVDYGVIDNYFQFPGTSGYMNGDFNFDGVIDAADYGYIDNSFQLQGVAL